MTNTIALERSAREERRRQTEGRGGLFWLLLLMLHCHVKVICSSVGTASSRLTSVTVKIVSMETQGSSPEPVPPWRETGRNLEQDQVHMG